LISAFGCLSNSRNNQLLAYIYVVKHGFMFLGTSKTSRQLVFDFEVFPEIWFFDLEFLEFLNHGKEICVIGKLEELLSDCKFGHFQHNRPCDHGGGFEFGHFCLILEEESQSLSVPKIFV
jgi:hypothetical protein